MGTLFGILGAVLIGKVAISAALSAALLSGVATVPAWIDLGGGVVTLVRLDAKLLKALAAKHPAPRVVRHPPGGNDGGGVRLCYRGAPSAQAARICED